MNAPADSKTVTARLIGLAEPGDRDIERRLPIEAPIALEYSGIGYAVMMATPVDIEDFVIGHALAEGLISSLNEVGIVDVSMVKGGWIARAQLSEAATEAIHARARTRVSDSSCGLCGVESIEEALRPLPRVSSRTRVRREAIAKALADIPANQALNRATGATHAAAYCEPDGQIICIREDVGRHNALDKLAGAMAHASRSMTDGFVLTSARGSYELVEKTVRIGCPMLVTISAPTSLAVERAREAGLTLLSLARRDSVLILNDPHDSIEPAETNDGF